MVYKIIEKLSKLAPHAVFTKAEAAVKAWEIIGNIVTYSDEHEDDYSPELSRVVIRGCDFDAEDEKDLFLQDVTYLTWDNIDSVIAAKVAEAQS